MAFAVIAMIGMRFSSPDSISLMAAVASRPSISGISTSISMTSTFWFPIASIAAAVLHDLFAAGEESYTDDEVALIERAQDYLIEFTTHMAAKEKDND